MSRPSFTAGELAQRLGGAVEGAAARVLRDVATLELATPDCLSWLGSERFLPQFARGAAGAVLVPTDLSDAQGKTVIRVPDPDLALCAALRLFAPASAPVPAGAHATAIVADDAGVAGAAIGPQVVIGPRARVGAGTQLHAGVFVGADARLGRDCVLWPNVVVCERCQLGDRVTIHPNSTIGADGFGYLLREGRHVKIPQIGIVVIEDDVEIGANTAIDRARSGVTRVRQGTKIDNLVQVGHNCDIGAHCVIVGHAGLSGSCTLGSHVKLGGLAGLRDHVRLGDRVQVAAMSGVSGDWPAGAVVRGIPAVDARDYARQQVAVHRLPQMVQQLRELTKRVEALESTADNQPGN